MQITSGIRKILNIPACYDFVQRIFSSRKTRLTVNNYINPFPGAKILDIGCGTATILEYLGDVSYFGIDPSEWYISNARKKYGDRAKFFLGTVEQAYEEISSAEDNHNIKYGKFDIVLALGVIHHLDDEEAKKAFKLAHSFLADGGHLFTMDGVFHTKSNPLARCFLKMDRGKNVRTMAGYRELAEMVFPSVQASCERQTFLPYTYCMMICKKIKLG